MGIFEAKRAGQISQETQYVLDRFQVDPPGYVPNVAPRVKDMEIRRIPGVSDHISLKKAWNLMRTQNVNTLPIVQEGNMLEGLITISDIAKSYMDVYDNAILSTARTQYKNILETLDGTMVVGNEHAYFVKGKVVIAAANPDLMENYIEEDDLVILGNRYESQLCAIEMKARLHHRLRGGSGLQDDPASGSRAGLRWLSAPLMIRIRWHVSSTRVCR